VGGSESRRGLPRRAQKPFECPGLLPDARSRRNRTNSGSTVCRAIAGRRHGSVHPGARQQLWRWATNDRHGEHKAGQYSPQSAPEQSGRRERMPGGNRWLRLSTNRASSIDAVGSKYDGSRRPPEEHSARLPAGRSGVDDLAEEGKAWVEQGSLVATVVS
jgi:hypothetical protein